MSLLYNRIRKTNNYLSWILAAVCRLILKLFINVWRYQN